MHKGAQMAADISNNLASWSKTDASNQPDNTDTIGPNTLAENLRAIQAAVRADVASSGSIASATTTDLSTVREGVITVTGSTTITALGTVADGVKKWLLFQGALTLTHNATSLILPSSANIVTAAYDAALVVSLGSGNWRCLAYFRANGTALISSTGAADGTTSAPGMFFSNDTNCGFYRIGADDWAGSAAGQQVIEFSYPASVPTVAIANTLNVANKIDVADGGVIRISDNVAPVEMSVNGASGEFYIKNPSLTNPFINVVAGVSSADIVEITPGHASWTGTNLLTLLHGTSLTTSQYFISCNNPADAEFKVRGDGNVYSDGGTSMTTPADYAEMFEWLDGNPGNEDRVGLSVALVGTKIKVAAATDTPIGIISGNPAVLADSGATRWVDKFLRDDFNRPVFDADGKRMLNPSFDPSHPYTPREQRPEWSPVGLVGKLRLRKGQITGAGWIKMRDISESVEEWLVK